MSYQKMTTWYDNDKDPEVYFLMMHVISVVQVLWQLFIFPQCDIDKSCLIVQEKSLLHNITSNLLSFNLWRNFALSNWTRGIETAKRICKEWYFDTLLLIFCDEINYPFLTKWWSEVINTLRHRDKRFSALLKTGE